MDDRIEADFQFLVSNDGERFATLIRFASDPAP
jgi:hypothetical protein